MQQVQQYIPVLLRFVKTKSNKQIKRIKSQPLFFNKFNQLFYILNKLDALVVVMDVNCNVIYVSNSSKEILGYNPNELLGKNWWLLTRKDECERIEIKNLILKFQRGELSKLELTKERELISSNGTSRWIVWNISLSPDNSIVAIGYDITKRKIAELNFHKTYQELVERNKEIISGIEYAKRLQQTILPPISDIKESFNGNAFVFYKPKDIVSGDFFWYHKTGSKIYIATIDCTGHGVPGALMSVIAHAIFKKVFYSTRLTNPSEILHALDVELFNELNRNKHHAPYPDGMDIALCCYDISTNEMDFAGAMRPLYVIRNNEIIEIKPSRFPIGFYKDIEKHFVTEKIKLQKGDTFYIFSDGYVDQFGGDTSVHKFGKKLNKVRFKELLLTINNMETDEKESFLEYALNNWKQHIEQTDDIVIIGVKV